jgi:glutaconate CoA-transferase subunit B
MVTDLCVMRPDAESHELVVESLYAGVSRESVRESTGWQVKFSASLLPTSPPTPIELEALRDLNARTQLAHGAPIAV